MHIGTVHSTHVLYVLPSSYVPVVCTPSSTYMRLRVSLDLYLSMYLTLSTNFPDHLRSFVNTAHVDYNIRGNRTEQTSPTRSFFVLEIVKNLAH